MRAVCPGRSILRSALALVRAGASPSRRPGRSSRVSTQVTASREPSPMPALSIFGAYAPAAKSIYAPTPANTGQRAHGPADVSALTVRSPDIGASIDRTPFIPDASRRGSSRTLVNKSIPREGRGFSTVAGTAPSITRRASARRDSISVRTLACASNKSRNGFRQARRSMTSVRAICRSRDAPRLDRAACRARRLVAQHPRVSSWTRSAARSSPTQIDRARSSFLSSSRSPFWRTSRRAGASQTRRASAQ